MTTLQLLFYVNKDVVKSSHTSQTVEQKEWQSVHIMQLGPESFEARSTK